MASSLLVPAMLLIVAAGVIYLACEYFVNGVEWVGRGAKFSQNAVGTVLAAFGTALPESVVTLVAVVFGKDEAARNIGVGAALGGPLVLSTVAYATVGLTLLWVTRSCAHQPIAMDSQRLSRDQAAFLLIFMFKLALGLIVLAIKPWLGVVFLAAYAIYLWREMQHGGDEVEEELEPLKFQPRRETPSRIAAALQTVLALVVIFGASRLFVGQLEVLGPALGIPSTLIALLLSPIATELPETMNAIIWIRQGKHKLALANISGAMMIQATIPTALGLFFTPWLFDSALILAGVVTAISVLGLFTLIRRNAMTPFRMALFGLLYLVFAVGIVVLWHAGKLG
jgi:cation:H+ antiporter